jgi:phage tail-like protein
MANYPKAVFHFQVEWGATSISFTEVSGLSNDADPVEYREGSDSVRHRPKISGISKMSNIILKRGIFKNSQQFSDWQNRIQNNTGERIDMIISLMNETHQVVRTWKVKQAFPVKVEGPGMKSGGNEVAVESVELAHEGIVIEGGF